MNLTPESVSTVNRMDPMYFFQNFLGAFLGTLIFPHSDLAGKLAMTNR